VEIHLNGEQSNVLATEISRITECQNVVRKGVNAFKPCHDGGCVSGIQPSDCLSERVRGCLYTMLKKFLHQSWKYVNRPA
jgi:hypothetical protein